MTVCANVETSGSSSGPLWDPAQFALSSETIFSSLVKSSDHLVCPVLCRKANTAAQDAAYREIMSLGWGSEQVVG